MIDSIICMGANAFRIYLTSRCMNAFFRTEEVSERKMILAFGAKSRLLFRRRYPCRTRAGTPSI